MINWGSVPAGSVLPFPFTTYGKTNGESITLSGLAVTDIEVYKGTSMTQRSSDNGYALMDTDGIDIDGVTGFHGFSIDTGDNTDAGFYAAGSFYTVLVSAVTVDSQTVSFIAGTFRLMAAESTAGTPKADVSMFGGSAGAFSGGRPEVNTTHAAGTAWNSGAIGASTLAADTLTAAKIAADVTTELQSGLATASALSTLTGYVDTEVAAIKAKTDNLPSDPADASDIAASFSSIASTLTTIASYIDTEIAAIKAKTDNLPASPAATGDIPSAGAVADAVWDEALSGHVAGGSTGAALNAAGGAGDPWITALPGAYSAGSAGYLVGTYVNSSIAAIASLLSTVAGYIDTEVAAIKAKTDNLPSDPADASDIAASFSSVTTLLNTLAGYVDTEVAAVKAKTDQLVFTKANELDVNVQSVNGATVAGTGASGDEWGPV